MNDRSNEYDWTTCECGKEFQVNAWFARLKLACPACEALFALWHDHCPGSITEPGSSSACMLPFRHKGRCQRDDSFDDQIAEIVAGRAAAVVDTADEPWPRRMVLLECGYVHLVRDDAPMPEIGEQYLCGKHRYEHKVVSVSVGALPGKETQ